MLCNLKRKAFSSLQPCIMLACVAEPYIYIPGRSQGKNIIDIPLEREIKEYFSRNFDSLIHLTDNSHTSDAVH